MNLVKEPCTAIFAGSTGCGKTKLVLDLLQNKYKHHFEFVVIICPTLRWNQTYLERSWLWKDDHVFLVEDCDDIFGVIKFFSGLFAGRECLFIVDDMIADEKMDKRRQPLLELAISGRHRKHSLFLLTQSYTAIPKNLRRQCKMLFVWWLKERSDLKIVDDESGLIDDFLEGLVRD